jgi:hypothetical protein
MLQMRGFSSSPRGKLNSGAAIVAADWECRVPTLFRLLVVVGLLVALAYGAMVAMVTFLHPQQREMSQVIAIPKLAK